MKPAYEIVRAEELRVGDVAMCGTIDGLDEFEALSIRRIENGEVEIGIGLQLSIDLGEDEEVCRQLPPEQNPEVLMRALKKTCTRLRDIDWESNESDPSGFIEQAIRELESEATE